MNELVFVRPNGLVLGEVLLDLHTIFPFIAHEAQRGSYDVGDFHLVPALSIRVGEHAQV